MSQRGGPELWRVILLPQAAGRRLHSLQQVVVGSLAHNKLMVNNIELNV